MWRGGCIIRSAFLNNIRDAFEKDAGLTNLLLDQFFEKAVENAQASWRRVVSQAALLGIPMPAISAALAYYDGYRTETCCRLSVISSALTRTSDSTNHVASSSILTGQDAAVQLRLPPTTCRTKLYNGIVH